jgi:hypothetical protein
VAVAVMTVALVACSDGSSGPPVTTPPPATSASAPATTVDPTPTVVTTAIPFAGGIMGPVAPGPTEPANR